LVAYYAGHSHLSVVTWALMALLVLAGVCVMIGLRVGLYLGIAAGAATALAGVLAWAGLGGAKAALPINPAIAVVIGLYLCARVATTTPRGPLPHPSDSKLDSADRASEPKQSESSP
jgi:hypothetical protein